MKKGKRIVAFLLACVMVLLAGCGPADGWVYSKGAVKRHVRQLCDEKVKIVKVDYVSESPREVDYYFESKERNLEFQVRSYRMGVGFPGSGTLGYQPHIDDNYVMQVHAYYKDRMDPIFKGIEEYTSAYRNPLVEKTEDVTAIAQVIYDANMVYREELKYNSKQFLKDYPYCYISVQAYTTDEEDSDGKVGFIQYSIDGSKKSAKKIEKEIKFALAQGITDGRFSAETYSGLEKITAKQHATKLEHIYLNDEEMLYDNNSSPYVYFGLVTDDYNYAKYDYDAGSYMMTCDVGMVADYWGSPALVIPEYVDRLGGEYKLLSTHQEERKLNLESAWRIGDHTWHLKAKYKDRKDDNYSKQISKVKLYKDGKKVPLKVYPGWDNRPLITLSAEDFCKLFDLTYTVDEEAGSIYFYSVEK